MQESPGEIALKRLLVLAQQQRGEAPARERWFSEQIERRVAERAARRRSRRLALTVSAAATCLCLALLSVRWLRPAPLAYQVSDGAQSNGFIESAGNARVLFSDGSAVSLGKAARARIEAVSAHGARVELERGQVTLDIVKHDQNAWFVHAGPYRVHVTGTVFDVRWSKDERRFELDLKRGSVVITGPSIVGSLRLRAGQRVTSTPGAPPRVDGPVTAHTNTPAPTSAVPRAANDSASLNPPPAGELPAERRSEPATSGWSQLVARGQFQEVLDAARRRGVEEVLASGSLAELAALGDAARYARSTDLARKVLLTERKRFPRSAAARDAAFFLGGLEEDGSSASLVWYERYLAESPRGTYTSQALGRRMMILYRQQGLEKGKALATEYLARFPKGAYASAARKLLDRSQP